MPRYHISPKGPRMCRDEHGRCPYTLAGKPHFDNVQEAQASYEQEMSQSFGVVPKMGVIARERHEAYRDLDALAGRIRQVQSAKDTFVGKVMNTFSKEARADRGAARDERRQRALEDARLWQEEQAAERETRRLELEARRIANAAEAARIATLQAAVMADLEASRAAVTSARRERRREAVRGAAKGLRSLGFSFGRSFLQRLSRVSHQMAQRSDDILATRYAATPARSVEENSPYLQEAFPFSDI